MTEKDKKIAKYIILAQVASDGGKGIPTIRRIFKSAYPVWQAGYAVKDRYIMKAILEINKSKDDSSFRYYVTKDGKCPLVYFDYRGEEGIAQVSFHSPYNNDLEKYISVRSQPRYVTKWDRDSSRNACLFLRACMYA